MPLPYLFLGWLTHLAIQACTLWPVRELFKTFEFDRSYSDYATKQNTLIKTPSHPAFQFYRAQKHVGPLQCDYAEIDNAVNPAIFTMYCEKFSATQTEQLKSIRTTENVSMPRLLITLYHLTLYRLNKNNNALRIRTLHNNRNSANDCAIGYYAYDKTSTLAIDPEDSFKDLLKKVKHDLEAQKAMQTDGTRVQDLPATAVLQQLGDLPKIEFNYIDRSYHFDLRGATLENDELLQADGNNFWWHKPGIYEVDLSFYFNYNPDTNAVTLQIATAKRAYKDTFPKALATTFKDTLTHLSTPKALTQPIKHLDALDEINHRMILKD